MESRVDETMSACDMNVLLQEANFVALVESTAKRVDQFEQQFTRRIGMIEEDSLQRIEDRLQEAHELAKGAYNTSTATAICKQDLQIPRSLFSQLLGCSPKTEFHSHRECDVPEAHG